MSMLEIVLIVLLAILAAAITVIVILQQGRGADIGAAFGAGGANTIFGATGLASPLAKLTWALAGVFLVLCMTLAYLARERANDPGLAEGDIPTVPAGSIGTGAPAAGPAAGDVPAVPSAAAPDAAAGAAAGAAEGAANGDVPVISSAPGSQPAQDIPVPVVGPGTAPAPAAGDVPTPPTR